MTYVIDIRHWLDGDNPAPGPRRKVLRLALLIE
jgi:hypothetical protein